MPQQLMLDSATEVLPAVEEDISEFDGKSHYVRIKALMDGGSVVALCGKKWIPITISDAQNYPTCKSCEDLFEMLRSMD